jgi:hypothetical protein
MSIVPNHEARSARPERCTEPARVLTTPYCAMTWDRTRSIMRFTRNETPYPSVQRLEQERVDVEHTLDAWGRSRLLVDLRAAAPRNDPAFEAAIAGFRRGLFRGGKRMAVLVRTAVGALQVKRHMREDGIDAEVFLDEEEALAYLDIPIGVARYGLGSYRSQASTPASMKRYG